MHNSETAAAGHLSLFTKVLDLPQISNCAQRTYCSEHTLKFVCILVGVQQRYGALKLRLVKRDYVPQSALNRGGGENGKSKEPLLIRPSTTPKTIWSQ